MSSEARPPAQAGGGQSGGQSGGHDRGHGAVPKTKRATSEEKTSLPVLDVSALMSSSQNLPAALNDPRRGKQRDFFTRSWGDSFTESRGIPPSPHVCDVPARSFEKYVRKLRRHQARKRHQRSPNNKAEQDQDFERSSSSSSSSPSAASQVNRVTTHVSHVFLDPNFDLTKPETFASIFPISQEKSFSQQVETVGRLIQEKLSHQLDEVEVSIARQVAQKSQHFFQVMTYHDALMTQLRSLVKLVRTLRERLKYVDEASLKPSLDLCRLSRRLQNANRVLDRLCTVSSVHQTQPAIQSLLSSNEFSGALDLITTSCEILQTDLVGVVAFKHLQSQLHEIQTFIGKVLLNDFQSFISSEINKETVHVKATSLNGDFSKWDDFFDRDRLSSVIFGLLRQNSFTFLEALEEAAVGAVKTAMREVAVNFASTLNNNNNNTSLRPSESSVSLSDQPTQPGSVNTLSGLVGDFASKASSHEWVDLFDVLSGCLLVLLHRIHVIHQVINESIQSVSAQQKTRQQEEEDSAAASSSSSGAIHVPEAQLESLMVSNVEVLYNVCEQMHERLAKLLTTRARGEEAVALVTVQELTSLGLVVAIFAEETQRRSGRRCTGLELSLQSQTVLFAQSFHDQHRKQLEKQINAETWRRANSDLTNVVNRLNAIPSIRRAFLVDSDEEEDEDDEVDDSNDATAATSEESEDNDGSRQKSLTNGVSNGGSRTGKGRGHDGTKNNNNNNKGTFVVGKEAFAVTEIVPTFLNVLVEYCNLCTMLPSVTVELGLKTAELLKFFNSRVCQLVLGAGAINVSGLKTITIRNLALALRSVQLVLRLVPYVLLHFQACYSERSSSVVTNGVGGASSSSSSTSPVGPTQVNPRAESRQFETLQRQFDNASKHLKNHVDEANGKILSVVDGFTMRHVQDWKPPSQIPSAGFKALCKQLTKLHESTADVWPGEQVLRLFQQVHARLLRAVQDDLVTARAMAYDSAVSRSLQSELTFYGQSMLRLKVLPEEELSRERFERLWGVGVKSSGGASKR